MLDVFPGLRFLSCCLKQKVYENKVRKQKVKLGDALLAQIADNAREVHVKKELKNKLGSSLPLSSDKEAANKRL